MSKKTRSIIETIILLVLVLITMLLIMSMYNTFKNNKNDKLELKQLVIVELYSYQETHNVIEEFSINGVVDVRVTNLEGAYNGKFYLDGRQYTEKDGTKWTARLFNVEIFTYNDILIYSTQAFVGIDGHYKNSDRVHEDDILEIDYELVYMKERIEDEEYDLAIITNDGREYIFDEVIKHEFTNDGFFSVENEYGEILFIRMTIDDIKEFYIDKRP